MARPMYDEITFVIRDAEGRLIPRPVRVRVVEAKEKRAQLEIEYQFPDYEIMELVSEEHEYILSEHETAQSQWSRDARSKLQIESQEPIDIQESVTIELATSDERVHLLEQLKGSAAAQDISKIKSTGAELEEKYGGHDSVLKEVGLAYGSHKETRERGIEILKLLAQKQGDLEIYLTLGRAYASEQQWEDSALSYYRAGELATLKEDRARSWFRAAYAYWLNHQYRKAVEIQQDVVKIFQELSNPEQLASAKNNLAYYWAEIGDNLDAARQWCLENLGVPEDGDVVRQIEESALEGERNAHYIDTLGRIIEALGQTLDAFRLYMKANRITPGDPIIGQNLERTHRKLGGELGLFTQK